MKRKTIPVFFTIDDNYVNYLAVTLASITNHTSSNYRYEIYVINNGLSNKSKEFLRQFKKENVAIHFHNISSEINNITNKLGVRDYYTTTIYYRLFLPKMFPNIKKGIYLDADIVVLHDLAELFENKLGKHYFGVVKDASVQIIPEFVKYVETIIGVKYTEYFNSGVLLMNFKELRKINFEQKVINLFKQVHFKVAPDQDTLNLLCNGHTVILDDKFNVMPLGTRINDPAIVHYNLVFKPWNHENIMYEEYFWEYAARVGLADEMKAERDKIPEELKKKDFEGLERVKQLCLYESNHFQDFYHQLNDVAPKDYRINKEYTMEKNPERENVLNKIKELELNGQFDQDAESDPPYRPLYPGEVDYLRKSNISKLRTRIAFDAAFGLCHKLEKKHQFILKEVIGVENIKNLNTGAIITQNHFSPFDSFPLQILRKAKFRNKKLYTIIKEANYSYPGFYGYLMRNCNTLPLAENVQVMKEFLKAVKTILKAGDLILIYPEQAMWWNYRKPRPLKSGGFRFAVQSRVPVVPTFITMNDSIYFDADGYPVQEYTIHILNPIYSKEDLSLQENMEYLKEENEKAWKELYERVYQKPLTFDTLPKEDAQ